VCVAAYPVIYVTITVILNFCVTRNWNGHVYNPAAYRCSVDFSTWLNYTINIMSINSALEETILQHLAVIDAIDSIMSVLTTIKLLLVC